MYRQAASERWPRLKSPSSSIRDHASWYNAVRARILFQLGRYDEAALIFEKLTFDNTGRYPRDMAWRAAAYGHLGRIEDAQRCGELVIQSLTSLWRGDPTAGPADYVDWLIDRSFLRQPGDVERLRGGCALPDCQLKRSNG